MEGFLCNLYKQFGEVRECSLAKGAGAPLGRGIWRNDRCGSGKVKSNRGMLTLH